MNPDMDEPRDCSPEEQAKFWEGIYGREPYAKKPWWGRLLDVLTLVVYLSLLLLLLLPACIIHFVRWLWGRRWGLVELALAFLLVAAFAGLLFLFARN